MAKILLVDDEESLLKVVTKMLQEEEHQVTTADSAESALQIFYENEFDLMLTDMRMKAMSGMDLLCKVKELNPEMPVIMMTAFGSVEDAVKAMSKGAYHYLIKPVKMDELNILVQRALSLRHILTENKQLKDQLEERHHFKNIIGDGEKMKHLYHLIEKISQTDSTVLLTGESGTGKELVAKALHYHSLRKKGQFVAINCAALPEPLLESELFGHVKGAFTGAVQQKEGLFSVASGGSIFLDEVSSTSPAIQSKLLRVLQEKEIKKVGGTKTEKVNVRIIAATNVSLEEEVQKKNFREDLFYRLSVIPLELPPLRDRKEDIPILLEHFLKKFTQKGASKMFKVEDSAMEAFMHYDWPGNIRELENIIERMVTLTEGESISFEDLPLNIRNWQSSIQYEGESLLGDEMSLKRIIERKEAEHIQVVLNQVKGDKKHAAEVLKIDLATLYRKLDRLGLKRAG